MPIAEDAVARKITCSRFNQSPVPIVPVAEPPLSLYLLVCPNPIAIPGRGMGPIILNPDQTNQTHMETRETTVDDHLIAMFVAKGKGTKSAIQIYSSRFDCYQQLLLLQEINNWRLATQFIPPEIIVAK
jgi:hypothetical protein